MTQQSFNQPVSLTVAAAIAFIQEAHAGQKYGSMPYFFHPIEVGAVAWTYATSLSYTPQQLEIIILAAFLHDIIEDTDYTEADLRERFGDDVVDAVVLLSKDSTLDYQGNIQRIIDSENIVAMIVKLADNRVNRSGNKSHMDPTRATKLNDRYDMSIDMLVDALTTHGYHLE
jgi:guanosine-3',5'-bis(diphosphate) 3'-pyrophosphohydrolase